MDKSSSTSPSKRAGEYIPNNRRKRPNYGPNYERKPTCQGHIHARWLIESFVCPKVLGPGGRRLKLMKDLTKDPQLAAWISSKTDARLRVFNCIGPSMGIAKVSGLMVRSIFDEPDAEHSTEHSRTYDLRILIPDRFIADLSGSENENLREVEKESNATLSVDNASRPYSDEMVVHIQGVADAIQIAVFYLLETLKKVYDSQNIDPRTLTWAMYDPSSIGPSSSVSSSSNQTPKQPSSPHLLPSNANDVPEKKMELPAMDENGNLPQNIYTAYDIAKDSTRSRLRQVVRIGKPKNNKKLLEVIRLVTECNVKELTEDEEAFVLEGVPEENALALYLVYRSLKRNSI